jgi:itaconate CoA-transferase
VDSPSGSLPALLPPGVASANDARMDAVPALGAHTRSILTELGYTTGAIEDLARTKAT